MIDLWHEEMPDIVRLLRTLAKGTLYQENKHFIILNAAADEIERLRGGIELGPLMTTEPDIVGRLRAFDPEKLYETAVEMERLCHEAADEIERLRAGATDLGSKPVNDRQ